VSDFSTVVETIASSQADSAVPSFAELGLEARIVAALTKNNLTTPTPIQVQAIPHLLQGKDLIASAQTGTGKTAAFMLPALHRLSENVRGQGRGPRILVLTPTRELAQQVSDASRMFSREMNRVFTLCVTGGMPFRAQREALSRPVEVLVATPGRLLDLIEARVVDFRRLDTFVLDEADRMLDMGFYDDIMTVVKRLPVDRQTIMFSATMPPKIRTLAKTILNNPAEVKIAVSRPPETIKQMAYICNESQKQGLIRHLFAGKEVNKVIIFSGSKLKVKELFKTFRQMKLSVGEMHSDLDQSQRDHVMHEFRNSRVSILVATDIVARGIDIDDITMVINYDVPHDEEDYVHRIGRTARAGESGMAITFVSEEEQYKFHKIEEFLEKDIEKLVLPEELGEAPAYNPQAHRFGHKKFASKKGAFKRRKPDGKNQANNSIPVSPQLTLTKHSTAAIQTPDSVSSATTSTSAEVGATKKKRKKRRQKRLD